MPLRFRTVICYGWAMETPHPPPDPIVPIPPPPSEGWQPTDHQWKVFLYLSPLLGLFAPPTHIVAPLLIWMLKKKAIPSLDLDGRRVLNFQISYTIYGLVAGSAAAMLSCLLILWALPALVVLAWLVFTIIGAVRASNGQSYAFPFTIKLL